MKRNDIIAAGISAAEELVESLPKDTMPHQKEHTATTVVRFGNAWYELNKYLDDEYRVAELESCTHVQPTTNDEMIICGPIDFYSLCPHHLLPVVGKAWIGYVPNQLCIGLSKMPRLVRLLAARPIIQEDLCTQIGHTLETRIFELPLFSNPDVPFGVMVVLKALHFCMLVRGVRVNNNCEVTTSYVSGCFKNPSKQARTEFMNLARII